MFRAPKKLADVRLFLYRANNMAYLAQTVSPGGEVSIYPGGRVVIRDESKGLRELALEDPSSHYARIGMTQVSPENSRLPMDVFHFLFHLAFQDTGADAITRRTAWAHLVRYSDAQLPQTKPEHFQ